MTIISRYIARGIAPAAMLAVLLGACGAPTQSAATPQPTTVATTVATTVPAATAVPAPTVVPTIVPTSAPQPTAVPPTAEPEAASDLLYVDQGVLFSQPVSGGQPRQVAALPSTFLSAAVAGDAALVLSEEGIEHIQLSDGASTRLVTFDTKAQGGSRLLSDDDYVFYAARFEDPVAPFGKTQVGYYSIADGSVKQLLTVDRAAEPLGLTAQKDGLYLLPRGQDPSFGIVQVVDLATGDIKAELPVMGEGQVALAPDGNFLATTARVYDADDGSALGDDLLYLYDMRAETPARHVIVPPQGPSAANNLVWSPDSSAVYFALGKGNLYEITASYGLWKLDVGSSQPVQISDANLLNSWVDWVSSDGGQAVVAHYQEVDPELLDLTTGALSPLAVPGTAMLVGWER
jgi:hypothetical protein